jgi:hypothetical protein
MIIKHILYFLPFREYDRKISVVVVAEGGRIMSPDLYNHIILNGLSAKLFS